jgi:hypothetical protein
MNKYEALTDTEFDRILTKKLDALRASQLLDIPGIYEICSEHFNNEILDDWEAEEAHSAGPD